ncbi:NAD-dependent protein deacylase [uncultured Draconibacterium sp.]|uniref:SIR2 family NAD-dependent protein deacylase n=1 Tax=uncultured Draconibacterium sp. TaxID=1573823 RepID=UPI0029C71B4B|nr:NAD-dependent protein deacylase [uncultured Draconibacterium sp.]
MEILKNEAANLIKKSKFTMAFTGAGISVESGIPPFRGEHGLWNKYDPQVLDLVYFLNNPEHCWNYIREIFYDFFADAKPNDAHRILAKMERNKLLNAVVTQNIDNLHYEAGSETVYEFHGNSKKLKCLKCGKIYDAGAIDFENIPPKCINDGEVLKPDFIFFGEGIPPDAYADSFAAAEKAEVCIIVGSTGEVTPASYVPRTAKQAGATIIEINPDETIFTSAITDIHLKGKAAEIMSKLGKELF